MRFVAALFAALMVAGSGATAAVIRWELDGVFFRDSGAASGSFLFDTTSGAFSDIALQTSRAGGGLLDDSYFGSDGSLIFGQGSADPAAAQTAFRLKGVAPGQLATEGVLPINIDGDLAWFAEFSCDSRPACASGAGRAVTNWQPGGSTLTGTIAPVPLPAGLPLFASALALLVGFGALRRAG
jgi:hypothetical protein